METKTISNPVITSDRSDTRCVQLNVCVVVEVGDVYTSAGTKMFFLMCHGVK